MRTLQNRIGMALSVVSFFVLCMAVTARAADGSDYIDQMFDKVWYWYTFVRCTIAYPIISISLATTGFQLLFTTPLGRGEMARNKLYQQVIAAFSAIVVLIALPYIISLALSIARTNAWVPPELENHSYNGTVSMSFHMDTAHATLSEKQFYLWKEAAKW